MNIWESILRSSFSRNRARFWLYAVTTLLALFSSALFHCDLSAQTDVTTGIKASGSMKSPLMLARFKGEGPVGASPAQARAVARKDFELSGVFNVADVEPLEGKP